MDSVMVIASHLGFEDLCKDHQCTISGNVPHILQVKERDLTIMKEIMWPERSKLRLRNFTHCLWPVTNEKPENCLGKERKKQRGGKETSLRPSPDNSPCPGQKFNHCCLTRKTWFSM